MQDRFAKLPRSAFQVMQGAITKPRLILRHGAAGAFGNARVPARRNFSFFSRFTNNLRVTMALFASLPFVRSCTAGLRRQSTPALERHIQQKAGITAEKRDTGFQPMLATPAANDIAGPSSNSIAPNFAQASSSQGPVRDIKPAKKGEEPPKFYDTKVNAASTEAEEPSSPRAPSDNPDSCSFKIGREKLLVLSRGDITKWYRDGKTDAIVNAANEYVLGGGGVDGAIHRAAGPDLLAMCEDLPVLTREGKRCRTGDAVVTGAARLPVKYVIHAVGPDFRRLGPGAAKKALKAAYENSLERANELKLQYVCFPAISCGIFGYPYREAAEVSLTTIEQSMGKLKEVHFVLFDRDVWNVYSSTAKALYPAHLDAEPSSPRSAASSSPSGSPVSESSAGLPPSTSAVPRTGAAAAMKEEQDSGITEHDTTPPQQGQQPSQSRSRKQKRPVQRSVPKDDL
eukprot:TRINITY_DN16713_c0_g1_i1.p1 TRINITY_DN16713_c0_g1~~TRINITY_DN16713_c0_g1_i1.p1  ORF type:complete len:456 (-),score=68.37 TRINITY_DN16713_c0_g1_i1:280-1647(-)